MYLVLDNIIKTFTSRGGVGEVTAVDGVSLNIQRGDLVTLLGPSGCGKTTTLRLIAGFEFPTSGRILLDGQAINDLPPHKREMSMVFQSYAIFPHLNVFENIAYGLNVQKRSRDEIKRRVAKVLELVELTGLENRAPNQLSGGQQQRVALARALVMEPKVLLMDEPLSNLDAKLREQMRTEIRRIQKSLGITSVYVTHDQVEAMTLSDQVVVMNKGKIEQIGTPTEIYRRPATRFVADFIGRANFVEATVRDRQDGHLVLDALGTTLTALTPAATLRPGDPATLVLRPEMVEIDSPQAHVAGIVRRAAYLGNVIEYDVEVAGQMLVAHRARPAAHGDPSRGADGEGAVLGGLFVRAAEMNTNFDLLFLGHFAVDHNVVDGVAEIASGGGVYYGGIAAARLGARVGVVTRLRRGGLPAAGGFPPGRRRGLRHGRGCHLRHREHVQFGRHGAAGLRAAGVCRADRARPNLPDVTAHIYAVTPIIAGEVDLPLLKLLAARAQTLRFFRDP